MHALQESPLLKMKLTEWITILIACFGAVLSVINTWYMLRRNKVKLKVEPVHTHFGDSQKLTIKLGLKVVNLSSFSITVSDVGFRYAIKGFNMMQTSDYRGDLLPFRLESKSAQTFYIDTPEDLWNERFDNYSYAYAITSCGKTFRGKDNYILSIKNHISDEFDDFISNQKG